MSDLDARVAARFRQQKLATSPYVCWFRTHAQKMGKDYFVTAVAAVRPTPAAPKRTERHYTYYVFPEGWFAQVHRAGDAAIAKAKAVVQKYGLQLREGRTDPDLERWLQKPAPAVEYVNFFWVSVDVPYGAGQKKTVAGILHEFEKLGPEFSGIMVVDHERQ